MHMRNRERKMSEIIKPSVLIVEGILKDVVMKKAIVTSSTPPARETANKWIEFGKKEGFLN